MMPGGNNQPPRKKRKSTSPYATATSGGSGLDSAPPPSGPSVSDLVRELVPAVTAGVLSALKDMGVIPSPPTPEAATGRSDPPATSPTSPVVVDDQIPGPSSANPILLPKSLSLGIDDKIKGKVWANTFVEFSVFTNSTNEHDDKLELVKNKEGLFCVRQGEPKKLKTLDQWFRAFHIYASIYLQRFPEEGAALMKYADTVQKLAKRAGDGPAMFYDRQFRLLRMSHGNQLPFDCTHSETYNDALAMGLCNKSHTAKSPQSGPKTTKPCFDYNLQTCFRRQCPFSHHCQICGGTHPKRLCSQSGATTSKPDNATNQRKPSASAK